jgi:tryptophan synthase alpha chain
MVDVPQMLAGADRVQLSIFLTAGYPNKAICGELLDLLAEHPAVSFVELGMPFSDPLADGATIQRTSEVALSQGTKIDDVLALSQRFREVCDKPLMLMGYCNPVYRRGVERFVREANLAGVSGLILPDLPYESHHRDFAEVLLKYSLSISFLVSPTSTDESMEMAFENSTAFAYGVANVGLTGAPQSMNRLDFFDGLQHHRSSCPVVAGFGITTPDDVSELHGRVDGVIIGSAFLRALAPEPGSSLRAQDVVSRAKAFLDPFIDLTS